MAGIACLIMGIIIAVNKVRSTRVLGIGVILEAVTMVMSFLYNFLSNKLSAEGIYSLSEVNTVAGFFCGIGSLICICIFLHKNYGKKLIYIPVLIIYVVGFAVESICVFIVSRAFTQSENFYIYTSAARGISGFVLGAITSVIIIIALFKNRDNEKVVPKLWLIRTILLVWNAVSTILVIIYNSNYQIDAYSFLYTFANFGTNIISLLMPIYTLVMLRKAKDNTALPVDAVVNS